MIDPFRADIVITRLIMFTVVVVCALMCIPTHIAHPRPAVCVLLLHCFVVGAVFMSLPSLSPTLSLSHSSSIAPAVVWRLWKVNAPRCVSSTRSRPILRGSVLCVYIPVAMDTPLAA
jgi:hypothetical protein